MTNFIPVFPLELVVYPGEKLNLHIFEPRYKQLISECFNNKKAFGIPPVINGKVSDMGTLMEIESIEKVYEDGRMDIKTVGKEIFRVLEMVKEVPDKLYQGAIVNYIPITYIGSKNVMAKILVALKQIQQSLKINKPLPKADDELLVFDIAHLAGLSIEDEFSILGFAHELHRQEFLKRKVEELAKAIGQVEIMRKRAAQNGHFKNLEGFSW